MVEIRIKDEYGEITGHKNAYINLKQTKKGEVQYSVDVYFGRNGHDRSDTEIITAARENDIYQTLKTYAPQPYVRTNENDQLEPLKGWSL